MSLSKRSFIDLARKARITEKKERALYKNFEVLEKKGLVVYKNKNLMLTGRGQKLFSSIKKDLDPYVNVANILGSRDVLRHTRKAQTVFKKV